MKFNIEGIIKLAKQAAEGTEEAANAARDVADAPWAGPYIIEKTAGAAAEAAELAAHDASTVVGELYKLAQGLAASGTARRGAPELAAALRRAGNWKLAALILAAILIAIGVYFGMKRLREKLQAKDEEEIQFTKAEADEMQAAAEAETKKAKTDEEIVEIKVGTLNDWANEAEAAARANDAERAARFAKWVVDSAEVYNEGVGEKERARYDGIAKRARVAATRAKARKETHETVSAVRQWRESLYRAGEAAE